MHGMNNILMMLVFLFITVELLEDIVTQPRYKDIYRSWFRQVNINQIGQQIIILIIKDFKTKDIISMLNILK